MADLDGALRFYEAARNYVRVAGLEPELEWQRNLMPDSFTEPDLLREAAWVVLCSGFRESIVPRDFRLHFSLFLRLGGCFGHCREWFYLSAHSGGCL